MPPKIVVFLLLLIGVPAGGEPLFLVVVHADNPAPSVSRGELARIFLGKQTQWAWGGETRPVDQAPGSAVREAWNQTILGQGAAAIESYWQRMGESRRAAPPPELGSDEEILDHVRRQPGGVGYVAADCALDNGVRALEVTGGWGGERVAVVNAAGGFDRPPGHPDDDEVVDRHGDVRLLLTGSCGPGGRGRRAVVTSAVPDEPVQVTVETTLWVEGRNRSSSRQTYTIAPLGERELDCTLLSESTEKRYALSWASDAAWHRQRHPKVRDRPPREVVAVVAGGTCGRERAGRQQVLINLDPDRDVTVEIEVVERVAGRETRSFVRTLRLAPGDEKRLGCSADGRLAREFSVARAEYRERG